MLDILRFIFEYEIFSSRMIKYFLFLLILKLQLQLIRLNLTNFLQLNKMFVRFILYLCKSMRITFGTKTLKQLHLVINPL